MCNKYPQLISLSGKKEVIIIWCDTQVIKCIPPIVFFSDYIIELNKKCDFCVWLLNNKLWKLFVIYINWLLCVLYSRGNFSIKKNIERAQLRCKCCFLSIHSLRFADVCVRILNTEAELLIYTYTTILSVIWNCKRNVVLWDSVCYYIRYFHMI